MAAFATLALGISCARRHRFQSRSPAQAERIQTTFHSRNLGPLSSSSWLSAHHTGSQTRKMITRTASQGHNTHVQDHQPSSRNAVAQGAGGSVGERRQCCFSSFHISALLSLIKSDHPLHMCSTSATKTSDNYDARKRTLRCEHPWPEELGSDRGQNRPNPPCMKRHLLPS